MTLSQFLFGTNLQTCVSSLASVRTDDCVGKSKAVDIVRIPWDINIPCQLMENSQTRVGTLEGQLYRTYDRSRLLGMSHLIGPGFPPMKVNNGHTGRAGVKSILTDNPFVRGVLDACRIQGLSNSEVPSNVDEWIQLVQHVDTSNISNLQSNVDVVGVLQTFGLGVSQRRKTKHLSSVLCGCLFVIRANTAACVYCQRLEWAKEGHGWRDENTKKGWGLWEGWEVRLQIWRTVGPTGL